MLKSSARSIARAMFADNITDSFKTTIGFIERLEKMRVS